MNNNVAMKSFDLEELNLTELKAEEMERIEGGFLAFLIGFAIGAALYFIFRD